MTPSGDARANGQGMGSEILLPFEKHHLRSEYQRYYETKRHNFFATIQQLPQLWECFQLLDDIWMHEFTDLEHQRNPAHVLPLLLFINAHAQLRVAFELGFSCCIGDAWNTLRSGIESVAHALKILREPNLMRVWVEKDDGPKQRKAFENAFLRKKKDSLFPARYGLDELHKYWSQYSDWGTHTTVTALGKRFAHAQTSTDVNWKLHYFEADPGRLATYLFSVLLTAYFMERAFFNAFDARLKLDHVLVGKRDEFDRCKEKARRWVIATFKVKPPTIWP